MREGEEGDRKRRERERERERERVEERLAIGVESTHYLLV